MPVTLINNGIQHVFFHDGRYIHFSSQGWSRSVTFMDSKVRHLPVNTAVQTIVFVIRNSRSEGDDLSSLPESCIP